MLDSGFILSIILSGISLGMIIGLMAIGISLIFGFQIILNFAHYSFFGLGAYIGYNVLTVLGLSFWVALPIVFVSLGILGAIIERVLLSRLYSLDPATTMVFTFGLGLIIVEAIRWTQGLESKVVPIPPGLEGSAIILGWPFPWYRLFIIGFCGLLFLGVWLFLNKTPTGLIVRAGISDRDMVRALGINIRKIFTLVFSLGVALGGLGGIVTAPIISVFPGMGMNLMIMGLVVIIIGGLGSFGGTLVAAIICGLLSAIFTIISAPMANIVIFIFMAIVLLVKPGGFFGEVDRYGLLGR